MAKAAAAMPASWEELPSDLLGLVLRWLPSLADRVHLRAVCRPWRAGAAAKRHTLLPSPLPWLALRDGRIVDLRNAPIHCAPILRKGIDLGYLAVDNLAFLVHDDGGCSLMNPLTAEMFPLPMLAPAVRRAIDESKYYDQSYSRKVYVKAVMSSPLDSTTDPLIAVIILEGNGVAVSACNQLDAVSMSLGPDSPNIDDIAFIQGKLYALTSKEGLHVVELDAHGLNQKKSSLGFHQCITDNPTQQQIYYPKQQQMYFVPGKTYPEYLVMRYLAESDGRLLMVRRWMSIPPKARLGDCDRTLRFEVFEADLTTVPGCWRKVESLGGQAIFLGSECSKSVLASQSADGVQEDCIYFMHQVFDNPSSEMFGPCVDPLADSGVYNMKSGQITPLVPEDVMTELRREHQFLTWFFPTDDDSAATQTSVSYLILPY